MPKVIPPTCKDFYDEEYLEEKGFKRLHEGIVETTRWGVLLSEVYLRQSDATMWQVSYRYESDGEVHGLRDGDATIIQVEDKEVTTTQYVPIKED